MRIQYACKKVLFILTISVIVGQNSFSQHLVKNLAPSKEINANQDNKMAWWHEAKVGMFIHWGLYSVAANSNEWNMRNFKTSIAEYSKYAAQFNPTLFSADEWAKIASEAGMKYLVITTKHHEGFALFKSDASPYNMVDATPFKRDIIKELAAACPKHDVRLGLYYSLMTDWGHPGGAIGCPPWDPAQVGSIETYFNTVAYPQVKELLTNYGPVAELWFDTDGPLKPTAYQAARIDSLVALQPRVIVNDRVIHGDFTNVERATPALPIHGNWEACDLIIDGSWGYFKNYRPQDVRLLSVLIRQLIDVVSKGGNMIFDVGPKPDGTFPADAVNRLKGIGAWLKVNGEAIYGTTASPFDYLPWGRCTRKGDKLYLHVFNWPTEGIIKVPMSNKVTAAWLLSDKTKKRLTYKTSNGELTVNLPGIAPDSIASVVVLQVKGEPEPVHSLALNRPTNASLSVEQSKFVVDNNPFSKWEMPVPIPSWVSIDLQSPKTFNTARIGLGRGKVSKFSVDYFKDGKWTSIFSDEKLPLNEYVRCFEPVTAQLVRSNIQETGSPQEIWLNSFELFDAH